MGSCLAYVDCNWLMYLGMQVVLQSVINCCRFNGVKCFFETDESI